MIVVKALEEIQSELEDYNIVIFGAHPEVIDYINRNKLPFTTYNRHGLKHLELLELMGRTLIYIGNSISDGMPNTLLEAIVMGAFPIQSNPGGVTQEIINDEENGLLIKNPESVEEIKNIIMQTLTNSSIIEEAYKMKYINF